MVHVPRHSQPTFLAIRPIAHADTALVDTRLGLRGSGSSRSRGRITHWRTTARAQSTAALPLLSYHHRARSVRVLGGLALCGIGLGKREGDLRQRLGVVDALHFDITDAEELQLRACCFCCRRRCGDFVFVYRRGHVEPVGG